MLPTIEEVKNAYKSPTLTDNTIQVDATEFMAGPGRYAVPAQFDIVEKFFDAPPGTFLPGEELTMAQVKERLGLPEDAPQENPRYNSNNTSLYQREIDASSTDYAERAYIFNSGRFSIEDTQNPDFKIDMSGNKTISNMRIVPQDSTEDFDFESGQPPI